MEAHGGGNMDQAVVNLQQGHESTRVIVTFGQVVPADTVKLNETREDIYKRCLESIKEESLF